jgi:hypothetical protein
MAKPVVTETTTSVFKLPGGTDENDLPVEHTVSEEGQPILLSTWELDEEERKLVASGSKIQLLLWGQGHPPVAIRVEGSENDQA